VLRIRDAFTDYGRYGVDVLIDKPRQMSGLHFRG